MSIQVWWEVKRAYIPTRGVTGFTGITSKVLQLQFETPPSDEPEGIL